MLSLFDEMIVQSVHFMVDVRTIRTNQRCVSLANILTR